MFNHYQGSAMLPAEFANVLDAQELRTQFAEWLSSHEGKLWQDAMEVLNPDAIEEVHSSGRWKDEVDFWTLFIQVAPGTAFLRVY